MALANCEGTKTIHWQAGGQAVWRLWQPQSTVMFPSRPLMSLLAHRSMFPSWPLMSHLAHSVPPWLSFTPDIVDNILLDPRSSSFVGQRWCQGATRSLHGLNYTLLLQDSSPLLLMGDLMSGLLILVPYKTWEGLPKKNRFCPGQPFQDEIWGKEVPLSTCQPTPPATHFLLLTLLFFVMLSACCLRWDERFLIVMAYSSRDKRVYFFLILDVLKTLYLHPATFKRRQKWNEANNFSAPLIKQPQMI